MRERTIEERKTEFYADLSTWRKPLEEDLRERRAEKPERGSAADNMCQCIETGIGILDLCRTKVHTASKKEELMEIWLTLATAMDRHVQAMEHCKAIGDQKPN